MSFVSTKHSFVTVRRAAVVRSFALAILLIQPFIYTAFADDSVEDLRQEDAGGNLIEREDDGREDNKGEDSGEGKDSANELTSPFQQSGGFLEIGARTTLKHEADLTERENVDEAMVAELELAISAGYRFKRFFFEASRASFDGVNLGVTLWQNQNWSVDFLAANFAGRINDETAIKIDDTLDNAPEDDAERERRLLNRDTLFVAAGARVTGYFGNSIVQFRWVTDYYENSGELGSARLGRQWQHGNWNLHGYVGLRYYSSGINNYWFGIADDEATERFPAYVAGNAFLPEAEVGASYPLTRDWVFASQFRYLRNTDTIVDSPLVDSPHDVTVSLDIKYVF